MLRINFPNVSEIADPLDTKREHLEFEYLQVRSVDALKLGKYLKHLSKMYDKISEF